jgi:hypothetical protein
MRYLLACAVLALPSTGCATFWDEVFSRERDLHGYFRPPDPLVVIHDSTDSERRAKALASLKEPLANGGTQKDQDVYLEILTTAAQTDRDPYCRLGAIQALGHFKDPRAAKALTIVYENTKLPFTAEFNGMIRHQALRAVEKTGDREGYKLMILVARQPRPAKDAASADRQQIQDERLIAIRALGQYRQPECVDTLVYLLDTEKDASLRNRAQQSLVSITGRSLPADAEVWRASLSQQPVDLAAQPSLIQRVSGWFTRP